MSGAGQTQPLAMVKFPWRNRRAAWDFIVIHYRFYKLNADGKIQSASNHELPDDVEALEEATRMLNGKPIEVWQGNRLVFRLKPDGTSAI